MDLKIQPDNENIIRELCSSDRIPHTVIIEGSNKEERDSAAVILAAGAVCEERKRPCLCCTACHKVIENHHPDVFFPEPSKNLKSGILSLKDLRDNYLSQISVKPNEAPCKVYGFFDADKLLREDAQNALLKTIEEPPQDLLFIFTAESAKSMLLTVRSRARIITLRHTESTNDEGERIAEEMIDGIVSSYEYDLLRTLSSINDKEKLTDALTAFAEKLRQTLGFYSGVNTDDTAVRRLARKLDRGRAIALSDVSNEAVRILKTNVNLQLLTTWLSSQYRRITWQK